MRFLRYPAPTRPDIYQGIHKGMRLFMCEMLTALGRLDTDDDAQVDEVLDSLQVLIALCRDHLTHENEVIHPVLESLRPGCAQRAGRDHAEHRADLQHLAHLGEVMRGARGVVRAGAAARLYLRFAVFVGENLLHMDVEESEHNAILWAGLSDARIAALHGCILARLSPDDVRRALTWMIPAMRPDERLAVLAPLHASMPAPDFDDLLRALRSRLKGDDMAWLEDGLRRAA